MVSARTQLVVALVVAWLVCGMLPAKVGADYNGCLTCHQPHGLGEGCTWCHAGNPATDRKEIGHDRLIAGRFAGFRDAADARVARGRQRVKDLGCRRCHRIEGKGTRLATDLDQLAERVTATMREEALQTPALFMPDFHLGEEQRAEIVSYLLHARLQVEPLPVPPQVVHFTGAQRRELVFEKQCGRCHMLLSIHWGGIGQGRSAPNLSGLFSPFYPVPPKEGENWNATTLERWLKNPRSERKLALMPPIALKKEELSTLVEEMAWQTGGDSPVQ